MKIALHCFQLCKIGKVKESDSFESLCFLFLFNPAMQRLGRVFKLWCRLGRTKPNPTGCTENVGFRSSNATSLNAGNPRTRVAPQPTIDANFGFENRPYPLFPCMQELLNFNIIWSSRRVKDDEFKLLSIRASVLRLPFFHKPELDELE